MSLLDPAFVVVHSPDEAVGRLAALHQQASGALSQALKRYLHSREKPTEEQRRQFRYPLLRLTYDCPGEVPSTVRAYAKVQSPGTYSVTVTQPQAFVPVTLSTESEPVAIQPVAVTARAEIRM